MINTIQSINQQKRNMQGVTTTINPFSIYTHFNTSKKKAFKTTLWKKVKLLKMGNCTFFHKVFYAICILKSFNSHISVVVCNFFEFGKVSKWCIGEWVKIYQCFTTKSRLSTTLRKRPFGNIVGKVENAVKQRFLLYPLCFYLKTDIITI